MPRSIPSNKLILNNIRMYIGDRTIIALQIIWADIEYVSINSISSQIASQLY